MRIAVIIAALGVFATLGIAASTGINSKINRVEDKAERERSRIEVKAEQRLNRIETKIDNQTEDIKDLSVALGRIEEKIDKNDN